MEQEIKRTYKPFTSALREIMNGNILELDLKFTDSNGKIKRRKFYKNFGDKTVREVVYEKYEKLKKVKEARKVLLRLKKQGKRTVEQIGQIGQ